MLSWLICTCFVRVSYSKERKKRLNFLLDMENNKQFPNSFIYYTILYLLYSYTIVAIFKVMLVV